MGLLGLGSGALFGGADDDKAFLGTGDAAGDENDIVLGAAAHDLQILRGAAVDAHVAGHFLVFPDAAGSEAATDGTRPAVHHGTVGHPETTEVVALDDAGEAFALRGTDHINPLTGGEVGSVQLGADFWSGTGFDTEFTSVIFRGGTCLFEVTDFWFRGTALPLVNEPDLDGGITVCFGVLNLGDFVLTYVNDGHGDGFAFVVVDVGHAQFFA